MLALKSALPAGPDARSLVDCKDAKDLRIGQIEQLLREYQKVVVAAEKATTLV